MDERLKQRLVGAAVIVLLAVVFVPMLLEPDPEQEEVGLDLGASSDAESGFSSRIIPLEEPAAEASEAAAPPDPEAASSDGEDEMSATCPESEAPETLPAAELSAAESSDSESLVAVVLEAGGSDAAETPRAPESPETPEDADVAAAAAAAEEAEEGSPARGWAAQLGSFSERRNALVLRNRLRAQGYSAFTESAVGEQGEVTRVLVGPEPTRARTVEIIEALRRDSGLDGFVVRHPRG